MNVGDYVTKIDGKMHKGRSGIIIAIYNTQISGGGRGGWPVAEVLSGGEVVKWGCHLLEVINENR